MKTLIAAVVIAVHALSVMAAMNPEDETVQPGRIVAPSSGTEPQLPAVVVTASRTKEHGGRGGTHAACGETSRSVI